MDILQMKFNRVFPLLIQKALRKGRSRDDVFNVTRWLTGYTDEMIEKALTDNELLYCDFLNQAPHWNEKAALIKGSICGVRVETIEEPTMRRIRELDKLVDELAKGKAVERILRT